MQRKFGSADFQFQQNNPSSTNYASEINLITKLLNLETLLRMVWGKLAKVELSIFDNFLLSSKKILMQRPIMLLITLKSRLQNINRHFFI